MAFSDPIRAQMLITADRDYIWSFVSVQTGIDKFSGHDSTPFLDPALQCSKLTIIEPTGVVSP